MNGSLTNLFLDLNIAVSYQSRCVDIKQSSVFNLVVNSFVQQLGLVGKPMDLVTLDVKLLQLEHGEWNKTQYFEDWT